MALRSGTSGGSLLPSAEAIEQGATLHSRAVWVLLAVALGAAAILGTAAARRLRKLPPPEEARRAVAARVLAAVGELSAEDLRGALGWRKADCVAALEATGAPTKDELGIAIWTAAK